MQKTFFFLLCFCSNFTQGFTQNLVENGSFETACELLPAAYKRCGNQSDTKDFAPPWYSPYKTNPDFVCNSLPYIPVNDTDIGFGKLKAADASAYVGIGFNNSNKWIEGIAIALTEPLKPGQVYKISYKAAYHNDFGKNMEAISENYLGAKLYVKGTNPNTIKDKVKYLSELHHKTNSQATKDSIDAVLKVGFVQGEQQAKNLTLLAPQNFKTGEWQTVEKIFTVDFAATHLCISYFNYAKAASGYNTYFFIDDVVVEKSNEKPSIYAVLDKNKPIIVPNLFFDTGKSVLLPASFPELDKLAAALSAQSALRIEISGHTDNKGNATANQTLSEARASAVSKYLASKGIDASRLVAKGYGAAQPIAPNDDAGRAKNRRVEVKVL
jgi:outer membrane protein OmpA-like peptidoglycan-associated protein